MIEDSLLEIAIVIFILISVGIGLTIYEFREHIMEREKVRRKKKA
jgi:hypothetical protein